MKKSDQTRNRDIFEGPILPITIKLGVPILISNIVNYFYLFVDTYFIARIDRSSAAIMAGTGLITPLYFLFFAFSMSLHIGLAKVTGNTIGKSRYNDLVGIYSSGSFIALIIGIFGLVCMIFHKSCIDVLAGGHTSEAAFTVASQFMLWLLPGLILQAHMYVLTGMLHGEGKTTVVATALMIATLANIIFDPIFIFVLKMGLSGAGFATSIAITIGWAYLMVFILKGKSCFRITFNFATCSKEYLVDILKTSMPQMIRMVTFVSIYLILNKIVSDISQIDMASWSIVYRIDQLLQIVPQSIAAAALILFAQNAGQGQFARVQKIFTVNVLFGVTLTLLLAALYIMAAPIIVRQFSSNIIVINMAVKQIHLLSMTYIELTVAMISGVLFLAINRPVFAVIITLSQFMLTICTAFYLVKIVDMGIEGVYISIAIRMIVLMPLVYVLTKRYLLSISSKQFAKSVASIPLET